MRSASSYRAAKKRMAKQTGVKYSDFNEHYQRSRVYAAVEIDRQRRPEPATRALGTWAANGGRETKAHSMVTDEELDRMNAQGGLARPLTPTQIERQKAEAKKLRLADIDEAMERALTAHQQAGNPAPLGLNPLFAARARTLGWAEGVEFIEEKPARG